MAQEHDGTDASALRLRIARLEQRLDAQSLSLKHANARLRSVKAAADAGLWSFEPASGACQWSPRVFELYGREPALGPLSPQQMSQLAHPDDQDRVARELAEALADDRSTPDASAPAQPADASPTPGAFMGEQPADATLADGEVEIRFRTHPEYGPRHIRVVVTHVDDPHGERLMVYGAMTDITEQARLKSALEESKRKLAVLFEHTPFNIILVKGDFSIAYRNQAFDADNSQFLGRLVEGFVAPEDQKRVREMLRRVLEDQEEVHYETRDIYERCWETWAVPLDSEDGVTALCFSREVTEQRKLEEQVRRTHRLESLGVLAGGIAHDFNNLLVAILGNVDVATVNLPPASPLLEYLEDITGAARKAAALCRQMLAYAGNGRFLMRSVHLASLVQEMGDLLQATLSRRTVLHYAFAPDAIPVELNPTQIGQVVMNLISNASDALGDSSGVLRVSTGSRHYAREELDEGYRHEELPAGLYTFLEVSDTGAGMDAQTLRRAFEPFFTTKPYASGLGLAVVLGIVRIHRGAVFIESEPGVGTTVQVVLPAYEEATPSPAPALSSVPYAETSGSLILVVDDEESVRRLARRALELTGFRVVVAENGTQALELYDRHANIKAVLLDSTMPGLSGEKTLEALRARDPAIHVLLSSGYSEQQVTANVQLDEQRLRFLAKPYTAWELVAAVRALLQAS